MSIACQKIEYELHYTEEHFSYLGAKRVRRFRVAALLRVPQDQLGKSRGKHRTGEEVASEDEG